jgi:hypothetical protein
VSEEVDQSTEARRGDATAIAVIGVSCRFPGAQDPAAFWSLLAAGESAIRETPADRLELVGDLSDGLTEAQEPGVGLGGFVENVDRFDAGFFGISPREADAMDPQQRLALELGWEAMEDTSVVPTTIVGRVQRFEAHVSYNVDGREIEGGMSGLVVDEMLLESLIQISVDAPSCRSTRGGQ